MTLPYIPKINFQGNTKVVETFVVRLGGGLQTNYNVPPIIAVTIIFLIYQQKIFIQTTAQEV